MRSPALDIYLDRAAWQGMMLRGMAQDLSWARSAAGYEALRRQLVGW